MEKSFSQQRLTRIFAVCRATFKTISLSSTSNLHFFFILVGEENLEENQVIVNQSISELSEHFESDIGGGIIQLKEVNSCLPGIYSEDA